MRLEPPPDTAPSAAALRDADIVALLAAGEARQAFDRLVERYGAKVHRLCLTLLREPARAEEAAQDSLLRAWRSLGSYDAGAGALSTWLYTITRHRCLTLLERAGPPTASLDDEQAAAEVARIPAADASDAQGTALLRRLVDALPEAQRRALTLYYYEDRAVAEVAAMLGLPNATVKTHLHRGRDALRQRLAAMGLADPALWR